MRKILNYVCLVVMLCLVTGLANSAEPFSDIELKKLVEHAQKGDANVQTTLGDLYLSDDINGIKQDVKKAAEWYLKAAEQNHAHAQFKLGLMYLIGSRELPQDQKQATKWFHKSVESGDPFLQSGLGDLYASGAHGFPQDYKQAVKWYEKSAAQGEAGGEFSLGLMYFDGLGGLPKDTEKAKKLFRKAKKGYQIKAEQGDPEAKAMLIQIAKYAVVWGE